MQYFFGPFRLDPASETLFRDVNLLPVGRRAVCVLRRLLDQPGMPVLKDELIEAAWGGLQIEESNLPVQIAALRRALGDVPGGPAWIETLPRRGYRFVGPTVARADHQCVDDPPSTGEAGKPAPASADAHGVIDLCLPMDTVAQDADEKVRWSVGREGPLAIFDEAMAAFLAGGRQVVLVAGEAGIGKTTFIEMAMSRVRSNRLLVLKGCCVELFGTNEAFLPFIDALQELCRGPAGATLPGILRAHAPTWLAQMPSFIGADDRSDFQRDIFGATRERMLREFCGLLEVLADTLPVVLILEDLHWSDLGTLDLLSRFARRDRKAPILMLGTYRLNVTSRQRPSIRSISHDLQARRCATEIVLEPLSLADVRNYMALRFGSDERAKRLAEPAFRRTQGQPLFMVSLVDYFVNQRDDAANKHVQQLRDEEAISFEEIIPRNLRDMITIQIDLLSVDEQQLVEQASAAGADFSAAMLAGVLGRDALDVEETCESLARRAQILVSNGSVEWPDGMLSGSYAFRHALHREILYQRLAPGQRVKTHQRLAEHLERAYHDQLVEIAPVLARHFEEGRQIAKAVLYLNLAAVNAAKRFSNKDAESYLSQALGLVDRLPTSERLKARGRILVRRGWIRRMIGDLAGCTEDLYAVVACAEASGHLPSEVTALMDLSRFLHYADRPRCLETSQRAVARSEKLEDQGLKALVRGNDANLQIILNGWSPRHAEDCYETIALLRAANDPHIAMRVCQIESTIRYLTSDYAESGSAARRGTELARAVGDGYTFVLYHTVQAFAQLHMGAWGDMQRGLASALAVAERNASRQASSLCELSGGWLLAEVQDFEGARVCCDRALDVRAEADPFNYFIGKNLLLKTCVGLGDYAAARVCCDEIAQKVEVDGIQMDAYIRPHFHYNASELWIALGDLKAAKLEAERLRAWTQPAPELTFLSLAHNLFAKIALAHGDWSTATDQLARALSIVDGKTVPLASWRIYATAGFMHGHTGDSKTAADFMRKSESVLLDLSKTLSQNDPLRASLRAASADEHARIVQIVDIGTVR